ncbi:S-adenosyl-L-methionine-dependent methyltransferase superfamily protein [Zea mays]|uniref:S-adenosyl-L-methionine-dependent methyltransferase superfamily protein n=1 Tax=Zea mays TaxID=4577 RepID=A0A1D6KPS3_MAIZE|nr:S-adenosyl-L-methionine-dependent methyltransferase superfamily protein [Zea mays]
MMLPVSNVQRARNATPTSKITGILQCQLVRQSTPSPCQWQQSCLGKEVRLFLLGLAVLLCLGARGLENIGGLISFCYSID